MTHVGIIGTGSMAQAISGILSRGGASVQLVGRDGALDPATDVVVLAVPYPAVADVIAQHGAALAGKVVVDLTNPVDFSTFDSLAVPADGSAAAVIAEALPESHVLKAFNTTFAATLASGTVTGSTGSTEPTTVLIAGDDTTAKDTLAGLVEAGGLRAVDAGSLRRARELESLGFLQLALAIGEKLPWTGGFAVVA